MRLRYQRRQQEARKFSLINAGRRLQQRSSQSKSRLSVMMENNCKKEKIQTEELEKVISVIVNLVSKLAFPLYIYIRERVRILGSEQFQFIHLLYS